MRMRWMLVIAFVAMFVAGGMVGGLVAVNQQPQPDRPERQGPHSRLTSQLDLSDEQREQMKQIWAEAMREQMHAIEQQRRELGRQREQAIRDLMTPEQLAQVEQIEAAHEAKAAEIREARRDVFADAHARTRALLTPEQQVKFDAEIQRRREAFGKWGDDRGRSWHRSRNGKQKDSQQNEQTPPQRADQPADAG